MTTAEELRLARQQHEAAPHGEAGGQCECGSYRLDGLPPVLHRSGCRYGGEDDVTLADEQFARWVRGGPSTP